VSSSISGARFLQGEGIVSAVGKYCLEKEAKVCTWSSRKCHPDDLRTCELTRLAAHFEYMTNNGGMRLEPLLNLLNGLRRESDKQELWPRVVDDVSRVLDGRSQIEAAVSSPGGDHLAVCLETKRWLGLKTRQTGFLYTIRDRAAVAGSCSANVRRKDGCWRRCCRIRANQSKTRTGTLDLLRNNQSAAALRPRALSIIPIRLFSPASCFSTSVALAGKIAGNARKKPPRTGP
jgi:hypothetical protein